MGTPLAVLCVKLHGLIELHGPFGRRTQLWPQVAASVQLQHLLPSSGKQNTLFTTSETSGALTLRQCLGTAHLSAEEDDVRRLVGLCASFPVQLSDFIRCQGATEHKQKQHASVKQNYANVRHKCFGWTPQCNSSINKFIKHICVSSVFFSPLCVDFSTCSEEANETWSLQPQWKYFYTRVE